MISVKIITATGAEQIMPLPNGWHGVQLAAVRQEGGEDFTLLLRLVGEPLSGTLADAEPVTVEPGAPVIDYLLRGQS